MYQKEQIQITRNELLKLGQELSYLNLDNLNKYFLFLLDLNKPMIEEIKEIMNKQKLSSFVSEQFDLEMKMLYNEYAEKNEQGTIINFNPNNLEYLKAIEDLKLIYQSDYKSMLNRKEMFNSWLFEESTIEITKLDFNYFPDCYLPNIIYLYLAFNINKI